MINAEITTKLKPRRIRGYTDLRGKTNPWAEEKQLPLRKFINYIG